MGSWKRAYKDLDKECLGQLSILEQVIDEKNGIINKLEIKEKRSKKNFDKLMELYNASLVQNDRLKSANTYLGNVNNINNL